MNSDILHDLHSVLRNEDGKLAYIILPTFSHHGRGSRSRRTVNGLPSTSAFLQALHSRESDAVERAASSKLHLQPPTRASIPHPSSTTRKWRIQKLRRDAHSTIPPTETSTTQLTDYQTSEPLPSLVSQNVTQVYTSHPHDVPNIARLQATTLTKLVRSILASFLSLVDVLAKDPVQYSKRIEDLSTLFLNAHHLINEYRPHQARESLIRILEEKIETMREEVREVARFKGEVGTMLSATGQDDAEELKETGPDRKSTKDDARDAFQKRVWAEMEAIGT